tara:strand:- start:17106 stop:17528 length:423 start_codon:yes stop_codon:yes gene_type:complete
MSNSDDDTSHDFHSRRKGEVGPSICFRAHRIHRINGSWYFLTREGGNVGPFPNREETETCLSKFFEAAKGIGSFSEPNCHIAHTDGMNQPMDHDPYNHAHLGRESGDRRDAVAISANESRMLPSPANTHHITGLKVIGEI